VLELLDCFHSHGQEFGPPKTAPEKHGNHGAVALSSSAREFSGTPIGRIVAGEAMKFGWPRLNAEHFSLAGFRQRLVLQAGPVEPGAPGSALVFRP